MSEGSPEIGEWILKYRFYLLQNLPKTGSEDVNPCKTVTDCAKLDNQVCQHVNMAVKLASLR